MGSVDSQVKLEPSWKKEVLGEFEKPYMQDLKKFLVHEKKTGKIIFPPGDEIFSAFDSTPFDKVKVVILGQDPYHGDHQAHGLCFSVKKGVAIPPSLVNIYKEMQTDLGITPPGHGYLQKWTEQGVLLLNSVLTVQRSQAASHRNRGWEVFTDKIIDVLNQKRDNLVFILWGGYAQRKGAKIDKKRHLVLKAPHPSPLSVYRGFFGSKPFSQTNAYLNQHGIKEIDWAL